MLKRSAWLIQGLRLVAVSIGTPVTKDVEGYISWADYEGPKESWTCRR